VKNKRIWPCLAVTGCIMLLLVLVGMVGACKTKPVFDLGDLAIQPLNAVLGDPVVISAVVRNVGDIQGTDNVTLEIDGVAKETQEVNLAVGQTQSILFVVIEKEGIHGVSIDGLTGTFVVKKMEPLEIVTESIPPIKLCQFPSTSKKPCTDSDNFTLRAAGGIAPYSWSLEFPAEFVNRSGGLFNITIVYNWNLVPLGEGAAQVAIPLTDQGTILGGLIMPATTNPAQVNFAKLLSKPIVFYPEKRVKVPVTIRVQDRRGNVATKKLNLELMMAE
jgi:hypothetical protein